MSSSGGSAGAEAPAADIAVICGPTAAGKSAIALWLAQCYEVVIVSADSRQVYRGFDVGTSKPRASDQQRVPHRGIDVADPATRFSAAAWAALAREAIAEARDHNRTPVVVGGTGFYISALFRPLWEEPALDPAARDAVQGALAAHSTEELHRWCESLDPPRAHLGRAQLLRALEVAVLTGERLSDMHRTRARPGTLAARYLVVDPGPELPSRIATRAAAMFEAGWVDEVRRLMDSVPESAPAWNATGYRKVRQCVMGEIDAAAALERIVIETRQFAKRQRTWFRHQLEQDQVERLAPDAPGWEDTVTRWMGTLGTGSTRAGRPR